MMKEKYESLALHDLKEIAKTRGMKGISAMKKAELVEAMLALDEKEASEKERENAEPAEKKETPQKRVPRRKVVISDGTDTRSAGYEATEVRPAFESETAVVREASGEYRDTEADRENRRSRQAGRYQERYNSPYNRGTSPMMSAEEDKFPAELDSGVTF